MVGVTAAVLVGIGGSVGAVLRHGVGAAVADARIPYGTVAVNVLGTFALGAVTFAGLGDDWLLFLGTGACGAFTTFSSFSVETVGLWERGDRALAVLNAAGTLAMAGLGLAVAWVLFGS